MRRIWGLVFFLVLVGPVCFAAITIDPMKIVLDLPAGAIQEGVITVTNVGEEPTTVSIEASDFTFDEQGNLITLEPGTLGEASLNPYFDFSPSFLSLEPGTSGQISYRIQLSGEATGSHWISLIVMEEKPQEKEEQEGIALRMVFNVAYIVTLYQNPLDQPDEPWTRVVEVTGEFQIPAVEEEEPGFLISTTVENLTNTVLIPEGWVEVRDNFGKTVVNQEIVEFTLLPYTQRMLVLRFPTTDWKVGNYLFLVVIDCGGETLAANQTFIELPPG